MPKKGKVGYSENTPLKQQHFGVIMQTICGVIRSIIRKHAYAVPWCAYIDLNAGLGYYDDEVYHDLFQKGLLGSPLIALQAARAQQVLLHGFLVDQDPGAIASLMQALVTYGGLHRQEATQPAVFADSPQTAHLCVCPGASASYLPLILSCLRWWEDSGRLYGVIYSDVNGGSVPFGELAAYSHAAPLVDILLHLSGTHRKRVHSVHHNRPPLVEMVPTIKKDFWYVRRPYNREQWTFLLGTNWDQFPRFERQGFVRADSPEGRAIMHRLSYPQGEQP